MKKTRKRKNLKALWNKFKEAIAFLSGIVTIVLVFIDENNFFKYIFCGIVLCYILSLGIYITKCIFNTSKAKQELERDYFDRNYNMAIQLHKYCHNLRNYISMDDVHQIIKYEEMVDKCQNICDYISEFYKVLFNNYLDNNTVSVCIKLVKTDMVFDKDYNSWMMETLARSVSTVQQRSSIDKHLVKISENSDFQIILSSEYKDDLFSFSNMSNIREDFLKTYKIEYKNSRDDFLNFYRSTIVTPIKIFGKNVSNELKYIRNIEHENLVLGFLCIDSMKTFDTQEEINIFTVGVEYAKCFGDLLYPLFEKILIACIKNSTSNKNADIENNNISKKAPNNTYNKNKKKRRTYNKNKKKRRTK